MKLISGLRMPSGGYVYVDGRQVGGPLKIVGMAFQNANLLPWRTTLDNVMLPWRSSSPTAPPSRRSEAEARQLLARVGLAGFEDKFPGSSPAACSSGPPSAAR
jgi:NitT/TauT family transport system ATP-binding protein